MLMTTVRPLLRSITLAIISFVLSTALVWAQPHEGGKEVYGYFYKGKIITLTPSRVYMAVRETGETYSKIVKSLALEKDPLSKLPAVQFHKFGLYRIPTSIYKSPALDIYSELERIARTTSDEIQPVFEQGLSLLIPSDMVIVKFVAPTTKGEAERYFKKFRESQGILNVRANRQNTYVLQIDNPANGRVYSVSQFFTGQYAVKFAEPNHIVVPLDDLQAPQGFIKESMPPAKQQGRKKGSSSKENSPVTWITLVDEGFEEGTLPDGWRTQPWRLYNAVDVHWSVTDFRKLTGQFCAYASGGGSVGVAPQGDYPNNVDSHLFSPLLNLAAYEEVYVGLWFYAKYQDPGPYCRLNDSGRLSIYDEKSGTYGPLGRLTLCYTGDLTVDPTTRYGWRYALFRLLPYHRRNGVRIAFIFHSDHDIGAEGLYIDNVRIVATQNVDTAPIGNDTYSARQYEFRNSGQIAGKGKDINDMNIPESWNLVSVSPRILVAVIDSGVDPHPDLRLDPGYDPDGNEGGYARSRHGTAVAGNVGAIGDNAKGVMGTAPGVRIMPIYSGSTIGEASNAFYVAVEKGANILTNSWGWTGAPSAIFEEAVTFALESGCVVLFASGNGPIYPPWTYEVAYPCNLTGTNDIICVGASSQTDQHKSAASSDGQYWWGSSYIGDGPDVVAPGPWSYSTDLKGSRGYNSGYLIDPQDRVSADYTPRFGGTSSSTPKVAGVVALMLSADPSLTPAEVKSILCSTADDIDAPGIDDKTGAGRVNAYAAVCKAKNYIGVGLICIPMGPIIVISVVILPFIVVLLWRWRQSRRGK